MEELVKRLQEIKAGIESVKRSREELLDKLQQKEKEIARLRQLTEIQNSSIRDLEQKLKVKRIAEEVLSAQPGDTSANRDLKFKINEMIREVDKVISLLHQ